MKKHQQLEKLLGRKLKYSDLIILSNVFGYGNNCHGIECLFEDTGGGDIQPIGTVPKSNMEKEEKQAELGDLQIICEEEIVCKGTSYQLRN